jgi:nucleobase transporter 1/2
MLAFIASSLTSVFESVGDYHAAARVSNEPPPPSHAINRGIIAEGMLDCRLLI